MSYVDLGLLAGFVVAMVLGAGQQRVWGWLFAGAMSYVVSVIYWRSGLPYGAAVAGLCDAAVCLSVYFLGRYQWEMWVWRIFQTAVAVNLFYLAQQYGIPARLGLMWSLSHNDYSVMLEALNWIALLLLGGTGVLQMAGGLDASNAVSNAAGGLRRLVRPLFRPREQPHFLAEIFKAGH